MDPTRRPAEAGTLGAIADGMRLVIGQTPHMTTDMEDPEFRLLVAACRAAYQGSALQVDELPPTSWQRVFLVAQRHRVEALCWHGLHQARSQVPLPIAEQFSRRSTAIIEMNMRSAVECARLQSILDQGSIPHLFFKGLTLGALAYPQPFLKMSWDIDILVGSHHVRETVGTLRAAGYLPVVPGSATDDRISRWHRTRKESVWHHAQGGFTIDLHSRLADNPAMLAEIGIASPTQLVSVAGQVHLPTLARDELFAYLCVHGASSAWFRLKWITDLAALLHREPGAQIERLYDRSQQLGAGRAADQGLLLADNLFGLQLEEDFRAKLRARPFGRWLAALAKAQLVNEREPTSRFLGTAAIHYSQPFLRPGWDFKMSEIARQARGMVRTAVTWG